MRALRSSQASPVVPAGTSTVDAVRSVHDGRSVSAGAALGLRLKVFVTRGRLDRQITVGHRCEGVAELELRARQLADSRTQRELARNLRGIVDHVDRCGSRRFISSAIIEPAAVRRGRRAILDLAEQLERAAPVNPRGVVLARTLITDGLSPLFNPHSERTVTEAAHEVQDALEEQPTLRLDVAA
jgi:hypothetical protein